MKHLLLSLSAAALLAAGPLRADPIKDGAIDTWLAGWYPNVQTGRVMTCPETCTAWVSGSAERESSGVPKGTVTYVCKAQEREVLGPPKRDERFSYGNQFDTAPLCLTTERDGSLKKNRKFYCLCQTACAGPDLIVEGVENAQWNSAGKEFLVTARIKNRGNQTAPASVALALENAGSQATGAPFVATAATPALAAGSSATVTFSITQPFYVGNTAYYITADTNRAVKECDENNNSYTYVTAPGNGQ